MKLCTRCKQLKELSAFSKDKNRENGLAYNCRSCIAERRASYREKYYQKWLDWVKKNPEKRREIARNSARKRYAEKKREEV